MFRVGLLKENGDIVSKNFETKDKAETWVLEEMERQKIKKAYIFDREKKNKHVII